MTFLFGATCGVLVLVLLAVMLQVVMGRRKF